MGIFFLKNGKEGEGGGAEGREGEGRGREGRKRGRGVEESVSDL